MGSEPKKREVQILPHAYERMAQRGATDQEVLPTPEEGEQFPAKFGRTGYRRNFPFEGLMANLRVTSSPPAGKTRLSDWARENAEYLGRRYHNELARRRNRERSYEEL